MKNGFSLMTKDQPKTKMQGIGLESYREKHCAEVILDTHMHGRCKR